METVAHRKMGDWYQLTADARVWVHTRKHVDSSVTKEPVRPLRSLW